FLTLTVRMLLFPLQRKMQTSMARHATKMKRVQPKLDAIKEKVTGMIPNVDAIAKMKETLGDKMPGMDAVKTAVETLTAKFSGNEGVMGAVKPLMDKLNALMG
ncbi:MAG: hypothetical protein AAFZ87_17095, partial [Planctomycetota bacterium]